MFLCIVPTSIKLLNSVALKTEWKVQEYNFDDKNIPSADDRVCNEDNGSSRSNVDVSEMPKEIKNDDKTSEVTLKTKTVRRKEKIDTTPIT